MPLVYVTICVHTTIYSHVFIADELQWSQHCRGWITQLFLAQLLLYSSNYDIIT